MIALAADSGPTGLSASRPSIAIVPSALAEINDGSSSRVL